MKHKASLLPGLCAMLFLLSCQPAFAGPIRDRIVDRIAERQAAQQEKMLEEADASGKVTLPASVRLVRNVSYGSDAKQRMDVYLPQQAADAPVIFMVHGGAWRFGDKAMSNVVENKVARWVPKGFIFISVNYRMLPGTAPMQQAEDVAQALAVAQGKAASWGGDPAKFVLMGHSAGAHLVALLGASPALAAKFGAKPWLGTIALDSAAFDVVQIMEAKHFRIYDQAFGTDAAYWSAVSPFHQITATATPFLAVCSSQRNDSCRQAHGFAAKAAALGVRAEVLEQDLSHKEINQNLGTAGAYTERVEAFVRSLGLSL